MGCIHSLRYLKKEDLLKKSPHTLLACRRHRVDDTFSERQKEILRRTWGRVAVDRQNKGISIFINIFTQCPEARVFFPFGHLEGSELLANKMFRFHAARFMNAVDTTIRSLDELEVALIPVLHHLGKVHTTSVSSLPRYLPVFMTSILLIVQDELKEDFTDEVKQTWEFLAGFISLKITEGYQQALSQQSPRHEAKTATEADAQALLQMNVPVVNAKDHSITDADKNMAMPCETLISNERKKSEETAEMNSDVNDRVVDVNGLNNTAQPSAHMENGNLREVDDNIDITMT